MLGAGDTGHGHVTSAAMYVVRHLGGLAVDPPRALLNGLRVTCVGGDLGETRSER